MAHHHHHLHPLQQVHIVRRQRFRQDDSGNVATTIIQVQTEIDSDNTPQRTLIAPAVRPRPSTLPVQDSNTDAPPTSKQAAPTSNPKKPSSSQASDARETEHLSTKPPSTLMVATKGTIPSAASTTAASLTYATATISATASATAAAAEGGMSGGAKAGLALGVLLVFCAILSGILLVYRRKKKQLAAAQAEDEKIDLHRAPPPSTPPVQTEAAAPLAPGLRANRTVSTAPRLSLRPVTQFDPAFTEQRQSRGNLLSVAAAGGVAAQSQNRGQPDQSPTSAWERPGAANAPVTNPFNDPEARSVPPSVNPFGNSAAIDDQHAGIPDSPPNDSPLHSTQPSKDFAKPGPAIAAAEVGKSSQSSKPSERPVPLKNANTTNVASSPAWADNLPASPGPAPTGALPIAGGRSQSPAPGPDNVHRVQLDFKASLQDELNLQAGQLVRMLHEYDDGWALCIRLDRSQQGVVPRTCLSKHPVKPRTSPPRQGPSTPTTRGPPIRGPMGPGAIPHPRPLSPGNVQNLPSGRNSPGPRQMQMLPQQRQQDQSPRSRSNSNAPNPQFSASRGRSNSSNVDMAPPPQLEGRQRSNSASQVSPGAKRGLTPPGLSPMNPSAGVDPVVNRKPVPGMAI